MEIFNVLNTLNVGNNTAIVIDGISEHFAKDAIVLSDKGASYRVLSAESSRKGRTGRRMKSSSLVIKGNFNSKKIYV